MSAIHTPLPANIQARVEAEHARFRAQSLNDARFPGKTIGDAHDAFDRVKPKDNWKMPIAKIVQCSEEEAAFIAYACEFMCGGGASYEPIGAFSFKFTHPGYYAVIGA